MLSLLEQNVSVIDLQLYVVSLGISEINLSEIKKVAKSFQREVVFVDFKDISVGFSFEKSGRHSKTVYTKFFFERIGNIDRMIYLDSDTVILKSLEEFWNIDLTDNYFGLVKTINKNYSTELGLSQKAPFFNDGIAIVNVLQIKKNNLLEKFRQLMEKYNWSPPALSEGIINVVCTGRITAIHPKFNFLSAFYMFSNHQLNVFSKEDEYYPATVMDEARESPVIVHYLSGWYKRPWEIGCTHPMKKYYIEYIKKTKWSDLRLLDKKLPFTVITYKYAIKILPIEILTVIVDIYRKIKV